MLDLRGLLVVDGLVEADLRLDERALVVAACARDRVRPKKSTIKIALNRRTRYRKSQKTLMYSPRLASPIKVGLALSGAPLATRRAHHRQAVDLAELPDEAADGARRTADPQRLALNLRPPACV